jgi:hypothetical protein
MGMKGGHCTHCNGYMRRLNRRGYIREVILPLLGLYPWECVICRKVAYGTYAQQKLKSGSNNRDIFNSSERVGGK